MYLIFDFDGTIVDSFNFLLEKFVQISNQYHLRTLSPQEITRLRDLSSIEIVKALKIPLHQLPGVIMQMRKAVQTEIAKLDPVVNLLDILKKLYHAGFILGILTSNDRQNVTTWLAHQKITHLFKFIYVETNFFSKGSVLKEILKDHQIEKHQAFYIGDETRDIEAAKDNQIKAIAVTWGFNSEKALRQTEPNFIAHKPKDLLTICGVNP